MDSEESKYIRINGTTVSVSRDVYDTYYKMGRREKTLVEKDARNRLLYYDSWDTGVISGRELLKDIKTDLPEDTVIAEMMRDKLHKCLALLSKKERDLVHAIFFEENSVSCLSKRLGIPYRTLGCRRDSILKKLRKMIETRD